MSPERKAWFVWFFLKGFHFLQVDKESGVIRTPNCPHEATLFTDKQEAEELLEQAQSDLYPWAGMSECTVDHPFIIDTEKEAMDAYLKNQIPE